MTPYEVMRALTSSSVPLGDALRQSLLIPVVAEDDVLARWINDELTGYQEGNELPDYRVYTLDVHGDATNSAWKYTNIGLPLGGLGETLRDYADRQHNFRMGVDELERTATSGQSGLRIAWDSGAVGYLNTAIGAGETAVERSYHFVSLWWEVPFGIVQGILAHVRQRILNELIARVPVEERVVTIADDMGSDVDSGISIGGVGHQVMIASPGGTQGNPVRPGEWVDVEQALLSMGIGAADLASLHEELSDASVDEATRISKSVKWAKAAAAKLGLNAAAATIATVLLRYLGAV